MKHDTHSSNYDKIELGGFQPREQRLIIVGHGKHQLLEPPAGSQRLADAQRASVPVLT